jgi:hypothetical protein
LNNRVTGDNCGNIQHLVYDLGSQETVSELKYVYCTLPGFSNGAVNEFSLSVGNTIDGTYTNVLSDTMIPEDVLGDKTGQELSFPFTATSGRYWKFSALTNHGNGAYIWTCELKLLSSSNVLAGISASVDHSQCVSYDDHALATDGNLNNKVTGSNCGNIQHLVYDLGSQETVSELKYVYCPIPGFSDGAVNGFSLSVGNTIDGTYTNVLSDNIPEDVLGDKTAQELSFPFTATSGRYWKFSALTNHGNGSYIWTCEIELY